MADIEAAKATVRAFYHSYNQKDLDTTFDTYISTDLVNHVMGGTLDRAGWLDVDKTLFPAFPDLTVTVLDQVAEGDKVATRYRLGGAHSGESFFGIPPSGNVAFVSGTSIDRVDGGQIVEHWGDLDFVGFLQQLSTPATTGQGRTDAQAAKDIVRAFFDSFNQRDFDATFDRYVSIDLVNHALDGAYDRIGWRDLAKALSAAFDDYALTILDQVAEGDKVVTRLRVGGTHTGEFSGLPASGIIAFLTATATDRVVGGQIVEHWSDIELGGFLQRLSVPATSEAPTHPTA